MFSKVSVSVYIPTVVAMKIMLKILKTFMCIYACLGVCNMHYIYAGAQVGQKRALGLLELEL